MLQARERKRARTWLMGSWKRGALAEITKQAQSMLVFIKDLNESQHVDGGAKPLLVLPVIMFAHGVKVLIKAVVQGVLICPWTNFTEVTIRGASIISITLI